MKDDCFFRVQKLKELIMYTQKEIEICEQEEKQKLEEYKYYSSTDSTLTQATYVVQQMAK